MISLDARATIASLDRFAARLRVENSTALRSTSRKLIGDIVSKTLGPPPGPPPKYYERTLRLVNGWGAAGQILGVTIPPPTAASDASAGDSRAEMNTPLSGGDIFFRAENLVPYAPFVEFDPGPWQTPFDERRGGYLHATTSVQEAGPNFTENIKAAWEKTNAA